MSSRPAKHRALFGRLLAQVRACWPHLAVLFLLGLLATPLALLAPLPLKIVFDSILDDYPLPRFLDGLLPGAWTRSDAGLLMLVIGLIIFVALGSQLREFL